MGVIYKITSPTGRIYIGQTHDLNKRILDYRALRHRSKKSIIIYSIKKYGWMAHKIETVEEVDDLLLNEREIFWITKLNTLYPDNINGMNLTKGGGGVRQSWKHDKERVAKAKLRKGDKAPMFGRKLSKETRDKISKSVYEYNIKNNKIPLPQCYEALVNKLSKPVLCYDLDGNFVSEYKSIKIASKHLCIDRKTANDALNGKQYHGGGYLFRRKEESYPFKIDVDKTKIHLKKRPILCLLNCNVIGEYDKLKEISSAIGVKLGTIQDAFFDGRTTRKGYSFIYKDLYAEIEALTA